MDRQMQNINCDCEMMRTLIWALLREEKKSPNDISNDTKCTLIYVCMYIYMYVQYLSRYIYMSKYICIV